MLLPGDIAERIFSCPAVRLETEEALLPEAEGKREKKEGSMFTRSGPGRFAWGSSACRTQAITVHRIFTSRGEFLANTPTVTARRSTERFDTQTCQQRHKSCSTAGGGSPIRSTRTSRTEQGLGDCEGSGVFRFVFSLRPTKVTWPIRLIGALVRPTKRNNLRVGRFR